MLVRRRDILDFEWIPCLPAEPGQPGRIEVCTARMRILEPKNAVLKGPFVVPIVIVHDVGKGRSAAPGH